VNNELGEQASYNSPKFRWSSFLSSPGLVSVMVLPFTRSKFWSRNLAQKRAGESQILESF
jgi:hypothetical protein